jgi:hypothetical protein
MSRSTQIEVQGKLRFTFQRPAWDAVKWDDDPAYRDGLQRHDGKAVQVVFWLEAFQLDRPLATTLKGLIERKLAWLKPSVIVTSRELWREMGGMSELSVESMEGAPWRG